MGKAKNAKLETNISMEVEETIAQKDVEANETSQDMSDTDTQAERPRAPFTDASTKYLHKLSTKTLESLKASWIEPNNCTVNTPETDKVEKARSEWVVIHDAPFDPKVEKLSSGAAFICPDIREPFDHKQSYIISAIAALVPKINRGAVLSMLEGPSRCVLNTSSVFLRVKFLKHGLCNGRFSSLQLLLAWKIALS